MIIIITVVIIIIIIITVVIVIVIIISRLLFPIKCSIDVQLVDLRVINYSQEALKLISEDTWPMTFEPSSSSSSHEVIVCLTRRQHATTETKRVITGATTTTTTRPTSICGIDCWGFWSWCGSDTDVRRQNFRAHRHSCHGPLCYTNFKWKSKKMVMIVQF